MKKTRLNGGASNEESQLSFVSQSMNDEELQIPESRDDKMKTFNEILKNLSESQEKKPGKEPALAPPSEIPEMD